MIDWAVYGTDSLQLIERGEYRGLMNENCDAAPSLKKNVCACEAGRETPTPTVSKFIYWKKL